MGQHKEFNIRHYLDALKQRWWVIVTAMMLCASIALMHSVLAPRIYESSAKVLVADKQGVPSIESMPGNSSQLESHMQTQVLIAESDAVKAEADRMLGKDAAAIIAIDAKGLTNARVIEITAKSENPLAAQRGAEVYVQAYLDTGTRTAIERIEAIAESTNEKKSELQAQLNQISSQPIADVSEPIPSRDNESPRNEQIAQLQTQIDLIQSQFDTAQAETLVREAAATPFAAATLPSTPISPEPARNLVLALVLGALIGMATALAWERFDTRLRSVERFEQWLPGVPVLSSIPRTPAAKNHDNTKTSTLSQSRDIAAEGHQKLLKSLDFIGLNQKLNVLEVTSATPGEGKSAVTAHLAHAMAKSGRNVIILSADLRDPNIHKFFGMTNAPGFTDALLDINRNLDSLLQTVAVDPDANGSVRLLTTGTLPPNPSEVLKSNAVRRLIERLRTMANVVIIDTPAVLSSPDSLVLSRLVDGVLVVANAKSVSRDDLLHAFNTMSKGLQAPIVGAVVTGSEDPSGHATRHIPESSELANAALPQVADLPQVEFTSTPSATLTSTLPQSPPSSSSGTPSAPSRTTKLIGSVVSSLIEPPRVEEVSIEDLTKALKSDKTDNETPAVKEAELKSEKTTDGSAQASKKLVGRKGIRRRRTSNETDTNRTDTDEAATSELDTTATKPISQSRN